MGYRYEYSQRERESHRICNVYALLCSAMLSDAVLCHAVLFWAMPCCAMLYFAMLYYTAPMQTLQLYKMHKVFVDFRVLLGSLWVHFGDMGDGQLFPGLRLPKRRD